MDFSSEAWAVRDARELFQSFKLRSGSKQYLKGLQKKHGTKACSGSGSGGQASNCAGKLPGHGRKKDCNWG